MSIISNQLNLFIDTRFTRIESHNVNCDSQYLDSLKQSALSKDFLLPQSCWAKFTVEVEINALYKRLCWNSCLYCLRKSRMTQKNPGDRKALLSRLPRPIDSFSSDLYTRYISRSACSCKSQLALYESCQAASDALRTSVFRNLVMLMNAFLTS